MGGLFCDLRCGGLWPLGLDGNSLAAERLPRLLGTRQLLDLGRSEDVFDPFGVGLISDRWPDLFNPLSHDKHMGCFRLVLQLLSSVSSVSPL